MNDIVSYVLINLIRITAVAILSIITYYGLPLLKTTVIPWLKEKHLYEIVVKMVQAAEKLGESETLSKEDKKAYVENALANHGITVTNYVDALIESAVKELDDNASVLGAEACDVITEDTTAIAAVTAQETAEEGEKTDGASD